VKPFVRMLVTALLLVATPALAVRPSAKYAADPRSVGVSFTDVTFPSSRDSALLHGWWFATSDTSPVVVVVPAGSGNMADKLPSVREWLKRGFSVLTFDLREFGPAGPGAADSLEGLVFTSRWVSDTEGALWFARARGAGRPVVAWGQDLGGPLAVAAAARRKGNADAIAVEGLFRTSQEQILWLGTSVDPSVVVRHRELTDPLDEPISAAGRLRVPVFTVLAGKDEVTPPDPTRQVVMRIVGPREFWALPTAGHDRLERTPGYFDRLAPWFRRVATPSPTSRRR
jgi:dienelactone hydrolase